MTRTSKDGKTIIGESFEELGIKVKNRAVYKTTCPNCSYSRTKKNDECLSVDANEGIANCHHCGIAYLIDKKTHISSIPVTKEYKLPKQEVNYDIDENVKKWFKEERGISDATLKKAKVTTGTKFMPQVKKERNVIKFNYFFQDKLVNIKYRDGNKNFMFEGGAQLIFYNLDCMLSNDIDSVVLVEGETDMLAYMEAGISNVLSVPNGASKGSMKMDYLTDYYYLFDNVWRRENGLKSISKIAIATDDDDPGIALKEELIRRLGSYRCHSVDFKGCNDPNEMLVKHGTTALFNSFDMSTPVPLKDVTQANELYGRLMKMRDDGGLKPGARVGSDEFKKLYSYDQARLTVITGIPSHGKSSWLDDQVVRLAVEHDWVFGLFSPESFPIELHATKLMSKLMGKHFDHMSKTEIKKALEFINKHFVWIYPKDDNYRLTNILNIATDLVKRHGINGLVIDPWTEIDKEGQTATEDINGYLTELNQYKRAMNLHIFLVAHPTKMPKDPKTGKFEAPDLYSVSGSSHFYNKADGGITIYRDFETEIVTLFVNKVKFDHLGRMGYCNLRYNLNSGRYKSVKSEDWDNSSWLESFGKGLFD